MIRLSRSNNTVSVWNAVDAITLREEHRIVGNLVGCLPRNPRQNIHLGLPLQLMPEEVTLLLEKGLAYVVDDDGPLPLPFAEQVTAFRDMRSENYINQIELFREDKRKDMRRNMFNIVEGKKAKRRKVLDEKKKAGEDVDESEYEEEIVIDVEATVIPEIPEEHALVQTFMESPWKQDDDGEAVNWNFPTNDEEKLRYRIFKDFWEKGHYLTSGSKFGGDFLVYPGDPSRFHSYYIAQCVPFKRKLSALDIVSMGRLGTSVKKTTVLCSVDDSDSVCYTSLKWFKPGHVLIIAGDKPAVSGQIWTTVIGNKQTAPTTEVHDLQNGVVFNKYNL